MEYTVDYKEYERLRNNFDNTARFEELKNKSGDNYKTNYKLYKRFLKQDYYKDVIGKKYQCECGSILIVCEKNRHEFTIKHQTYLNPNFKKRHICHGCQIEFTRSDNLARHKKNCKYLNETK